PQGLVSKSGGAIQVLGTPQTAVQLTSYADDSIGGDSNTVDGPTVTPQGGDWGGIVYRDDSDREFGLGTNEVQTLTLQGTGGDFVLFFNNQFGSFVNPLVDANTTTATDVLSYLNTIPS